MGITSKTGLIAGVTKPVQRPTEKEAVTLTTIVNPAPFVLRPLAGIYNPFPRGCSLLCNHPTPHPLKSVINVLVENQHKLNPVNVLPENKNVNEDKTLHQSSVPEELFRRYTETDSRPLTPTPTVASAATKESAAGRRCVTPDPSAHAQRPKLVLDLRRTHSQETLSWTIYSDQGTKSTPALQSPRSSSASRSSLKGEKLNQNVASPKSAQKSAKDKSPRIKKEMSTLKVPFEKDEDEIQARDETDEIPVSDQDDDEMPRRRGKKKKRQESRIDTACRSSEQEPETQIETIKADGPENDSDEKPIDEAEEQINFELKTKEFQRKSVEKFDSFLEPSMIKHLQRELDKEIIDSEFDSKRKVALEEAFRCKTEKRIPSSVSGKKIAPTVSIDFLLKLPRIFSRSSARFEVPLDSRELDKMSPMEYIKNHVFVSNARKLLYNRVFNRHLKLSEDEEDDERIVEGNKIILALGETMGKEMTAKQADFFKDLVGWNDDDLIDFRTWCGLCALCERILAGEFCSQLLDRIQDPCTEVERADFESLPLKLRRLKTNGRLVKMLNLIQNS